MNKTPQLIVELIIHKLLKQGCLVRIQILPTRKGLCSADELRAAAMISSFICSSFRFKSCIYLDASNIIEVLLCCTHRHKNTRGRRSGHSHSQPQRHNLPEF